MKISSDCFVDNELISIIESKKKSGVCDVLESQKDFVYDTEEDDELVAPMLAFLGIFKVAGKSVDHSFLLEEEILSNWKIFSEKAKHSSIRILKAIMSSSGIDSDEIDMQIFDKPVYIPQLENKSYKSNISILNGVTWEDFCENIKYCNRFHTKDFNGEVFATFLRSLETSFKAGEVFYRSRINKTDKRFSEDEMRMPPKANSKAGRIAAEGIPCFYLADSIKTSISEVRAGVHDTVDVGVFKCKSDMKAVDFRNFDKISPFAIPDKILNYYVNKTLFESIKKEIEQPLRSSENVVDYVPIQFLCDFIRSYKYDGIAYRSTMSEDGFNFSAFSDKSFEYLETQVVNIKAVSYKY